jgi:hypothetical protein
MFSLISIVVFIMAVFLMNKMFIGFQPGSSRINSDVGRFRKQAQKWKSELIPWNDEELTLFSLKQSNQVAKRGFGRSFEGVVQSIYHEPMLYYNYKEYPATKKNAVLFAQTARYEMVYRIRNKDTQVFVNEVFFGTLKGDGTLLQDNGRKIAAHIARKSPYRREISIGDKMVGSVIFPEDSPSVSPRAFDMDEKMGEEESLYFIVLGVHEVIHHIAHHK